MGSIRSACSLSTAEVIAFGLLATWRRRSAAESVLGTLAILVLVSKVTSPQSHLWLMPFFALVQHRFGS